MSNQKKVKNKKKNTPNYNKKGEKTARRIDPLMLFAIIACSVAVIALSVVLVIQLTPKRGEFEQPPFDESAVKGTPEVPEGQGYGELDARGAFKVSVCGEVRLDGDSADVWFTNPESNEVWLKLRVMNKAGEVIAETGLLRPGEYLKSITFYNIPSSGDEIVMKVMAYEPDTYLSAGAISLNTAIS